VLADVVTAGGAQLHLSCRVDAIEDDGRSVRVALAPTGSGSITAGALVNCGGLHSDRLARGVITTTDGEALPTILPFRGEYYELRAGSRDLVRNLIYPVPDPRFPFLGVHFTRDIHGGVHAGPNAVPALGREAYRWRTIVPSDVAELIGTPATWRLARRYWRTELDEVARSMHKARFVRALQRLIPAVTAADLVRHGAGVRAQAVSPDGVLLDDFAFSSSARTLHVLNAPSPAATASLAIGEEIASRLPPPA
jgi:L-2-hydroxyglutarate oxidase